LWCPAVEDASGWALQAWSYAAFGVRMSLDTVADVLQMVVYDRLREDALIIDGCALTIRPRRDMISGRQVPFVMRPIFLCYAADGRGVI